MNKLLIKVEYPMINQEYELFVPINKTVAKILNLIQKGILEMNTDFIPKKSDIGLYIKETGELLPMNQIIKNTNVKNGETLVIL